jgi:hypothetical protein
MTVTDAQCPTCGAAVLPVATVASNPITSTAVRDQLVLEPMPQPRTAGGLGCMTVILSGTVAFAAAVIIGGISQFTLGTDYPAPGYRFGEAAIFSGVAAFIIVMIGMFSVFVWRQANYDRIYTKTLGEWFVRKTAYENDSYCTNCNIRVPGSASTTP